MGRRHVLGPDAAVFRQRVLSGSFEWGKIGAIYKVPGARAQPSEADLAKDKPPTET